MSQEIDPQAAFSTLQNNVANNVFFQKLAQYGIQPANSDEASELISLAAKLRISDEQMKQAESSQNSFAEANQALDNVMQQTGLSAPVTKQAEVAESLAYQNYARQLANDPSIYDAVLTLKQAQADEVVAHYTN